MIGIRLARLALALTMAFSGADGRAQDLSALARVLPGSTITDANDGVALRLQLSQPVPYRIFQLAEPYRLIVDFNEVGWSLGPTDGLDASAHVVGLRAGVFRQGWSRLVLELDGPLGLAAASMARREDGSALLSIDLSDRGPEAFAARAGAPDVSELTTAPVSDLALKPTAPDDPRPLVMLDPGHGGIDPGTEFDGLIEAELMLQFAQQLKEALIRTGAFRVALTRNENEFVPLEARISLAHEAGADVFVSLHADALAAGRARGATIYTLAEEASDLASRKLAERHDRDELLAGVDLSDQGDEIALALMDLARVETAHSSDVLAAEIVAGLAGQVELYKNPHLSAGFSVLKSPDIPSVLIELGFLSQAYDRRNLTDPAWRARAAGGIVQGLRGWALKMAAESRLKRR